MKRVMGRWTCLTRRRTFVSSITMGTIAWRGVCATDPQALAVKLTKHCRMLIASFWRRGPYRPFSTMA